MSDSANQGTARSLIEDLRRILADDSEAETLGEGVNVGSPKPMGSKAPPLSPAKATLSKLGAKHARSDAALDTLSKLRKKYGTEAVGDPTAVKKQSANTLSKLSAKRATSDASMDALSKLRKKYGTEAVESEEQEEAVRINRDHYSDSDSRKDTAAEFRKLKRNAEKERGDKLSHDIYAMVAKKAGAPKAAARMLKKYDPKEDPFEPQDEHIDESDEEVVAEAEDGGVDLEKKSREKRKKKGGGGHNPFKRKSNLGKGPRGHYHGQTKNWKCSCSTPYKCLCRNRKTGASKTITIKRGYKQAYNKEYKAWRKGQRQ